MFKKINFLIAKLITKNNPFGGLRIADKSTIVTDGAKLMIVTRPDPDIFSIAGYPSIPDSPGEPTESFFDFTISSPEALEIAKSIPGKDAINPILRHAIIYSKTNESESAFIGVSDLLSSRIFSPRKTLLSFPDYTKAIPKIDKEEKKVVVNAEHLADVLNIFVTAMKESKNFGVIMRFYENSIRLDAIVEGSQLTAVIILSQEKTDE